MPTIEQRVVEMRFDNKQFEDNAQQSIKTIDKLNDSLDFKNSGQGLNKLASAVNNFKLTGMEMALSSVTEKFSALEIAGITAIQNITNKAVNLGTNFIKSNTIDQVTAGWDKYAQKTSAVQTIMAATAKDFSDQGEQMAYVNDQIEKLNWFTDETSYSLLDMTSNIGKFTSNGIALDKSVTAMQGISTWASISGATISDAGRAMYNLSQAMATGSVKLIDWKSIENANMATSEFKEMAIQAAVAEGTLKKVGNAYETCGKKVKKTGLAVSANNFNENLSAEWFTADVLMKTLDKYGSFTEQLYDFMNISELDTASEAIKMIDDYAAGTLDLAEAAEDAGISADELEKHLKHLSSDEFELGRRSFKAAQEAKTFREAIDSVTEAVSSGFMQSFEYLFGNYLEAKELWTNLANELYDVFAASAYDRNQILKNWHKNGGYDAFLEGLSNLWTGVKNMVAPIKDAWSAVFDIFYDSDYDDMIDGKANMLIDFTKKFAEVTGKFRDYIGDWTKLGKNISEKVVEPVKKVSDEAVKVVDTITRTEEALDKLVNEVIRGNWGNGEDRVKALRGAGYSYEIVQTAVNKALGYTKEYATLQKDLEEHEKAIADAEKKRAEASKKASEETKDSLEDELSVREKIAKAKEGFKRDSDIKQVEKEQKLYKQAHAKELVAQAKANFQRERAAKEVEAQAKALEKVTKHIYNANERADILRSAFIAVFEVVDGIKITLQETGKFIGHVFGRVWGAVEGPLWNVLDGLTDWFENKRENGEYYGDKIRKVFQNITVIFDNAFDAVQRFTDRLSNTDGVQRLFSSISNLGGMIVRIIQKIFGQINDAGQSESFWESIGNGFDWLADKLGEVADFIAGVIDFITGKEGDITGFLDSFAAGAPVVINDLAGAFANLYDSVKNIGGSVFSKVGDVFSRLFGLINEQVSNPESTTNSILGGVGSLFDGFIEKLKTFDINKLGDLAKGGGLLAIGVGIYKFIMAIVDGLKAAKKIPDGISGVLDQAKDTLKSYQREINIETIYKIAKSIGIFAASMVGLSLLNPEDLNRVTATMVILLGMLGLVMLAYSKIQAKKAAADEAESLLDKVLAPIKGFLSTIGDAFKNMTKMAGIGIGIVAFVAAVGMLANLAIKLIQIPWNEFMDGMKKVVLVAGLIGISAFLLSNLAKNMDAQLGIGLILFAASIDLLLPAIAALAAIPTLGVVQAVVAIGSLAYILGEMASTLSDTKVFASAAGLVLMAVAINMLLVPLTTMALLPFEKLAQGVLAIAALSFALAGVGVLLDNYPNAAGQLIGVAVAMLIMSAPLLIVGKNAEACAYGLLVLVAGFAALAIIGAIATGVAAGLYAIAAAAIGFGVGAVLFGAGCALVASSIYIVAKALPLIVDGLIYIGENIRTHGKDIAIGFGVVLAAVAAAIIASSPAIQAAIGSLISAAAGALVAALPVLTSHLFTVIMGLLVFLYTTAPDIINTILDVIVFGLHALADGMRNHAAPIFSAIGDILDASWDMIIEFIASIADMIPVVGKGIGDWIRGAENWVNPAAEDMGDNLGAALKEQAESKVKGTAPVIQNAMTSEMENVDTSEAADTVVQDFTAKLQASLTENTDQPFDIHNYMDKIVNGNASVISGSGDDFAKMFTESGAEGMENYSWLLQDAGKQSADDTANATSAEADVVAPDSGQHMVDGIVSGIHNGEIKLLASGSWAARTVDLGFRSEAKIESPSKVAAEGGNFWGKGLALGILSTASEIENAGRDSAEAAFNGMSSIIGNISSVLNEELDVNPTITPVLDLSKLQNGTGILNGMFGSRSIGLLNETGRSFEANRLAKLNAIEANTTNADVVAALGLLRGDVTALNDSMLNTQVVLDSGALVGATAKQMDNALGRFKTLKGRGI